MTKRQENIYESIRKGINSAIIAKKELSTDDFYELVSNVEEQAEANELTTIRELAFFCGLEMLN